jgi:hypothetical protein
MKYDEDGVINSGLLLVFLGVVFLLGLAVGAIL